jgi:hypothetical protein
MAALTTMVTNAQRDTKILSQKLEILQLQQEITGNFANSTICGCNFDPTKNTGEPVNHLRFNTTNATALKNSTVTLTNLYSACNSGSPTNAIARANQPLPGTQSALRVSNIALSNMRQVSPGDYTADLSINLNPASLVMPLHSPTVQIHFQANTATPAQSTITGCSVTSTGGGAGGGGSASSIDPGTCRAFSKTANLPGAVPADCTGALTGTFPRTPILTCHCPSSRPTVLACLPPATPSGTTGCSGGTATTGPLTMSAAIIQQYICCK